MYKLISNYVYEIKKSKFIAYYYEIDNKDEVQSILDELKKEHKKANHFPYAYKIGPIAKKTDDKEPGGTAGMPIYNLLETHHLNNKLIVVVRYFGGTKLGAGLLTRSYLKSAIEVIKE